MRNLTLALLVTAILSCAGPLSAQNYDVYTWADVHYSNDAFHAKVTTEKDDPWESFDIASETTVTSPSGRTATGSTGYGNGYSMIAYATLPTLGEVGTFTVTGRGASCPPFGGSVWIPVAALTTTISHKWLLYQFSSPGIFSSDQGIYVRCNPPPSLLGVCNTVSMNKNAWNPPAPPWPPVILNELLRVVTPVFPGVDFESCFVKTTVRTGACGPDPQP